MRQYLLNQPRQSSARFELTPLIDIIFILVIFFAVTTHFVQERQGLKLTLPSAVSVEQPKKAVTISIDRYQRVYWNGERVSESLLSSKIKGLLSDNPDQSILVQADQSTPYIRVISVLDIVRSSGCSNVMLEAEKKS